MMTSAVLEHLNITVEKPHELADILCKLFDWKIRWQGKSPEGGENVHVGNETSYLALYGPQKLKGAPVQAYSAANATNHIGVLVDDIDVTRDRIRAVGIRIADENAIAPGQRIYFYIQNLEFEAVMY